MTGTVADPKLIFKKVLDSLATGIVLIHNHPSGKKKPSEADNRLTKKIKEAGELLDISVFDHVIFTDDGYFSYSESGYL